MKIMRHREVMYLVNGEEACILNPRYLVPESVLFTITYVASEKGNRFVIGNISRNNFSGAVG